MKSFRRILFATDLSEASRQAFEGAIELSKDNGAELLIAHAYRPSSLLPTDVYLVPAVYEELDTKLRENAQKKLATLAEEARRSGVQARWLVLFGAPYEAIAEAARESAADLVIVGTHARVGVARFFLGSVASRVIATAPCPVLTVRASWRTESPATPSEPGSPTREEPRAAQRRVGAGRAQVSSKRE